jgi:hypothetical protein
MLMENERSYLNMCSPPLFSGVLVTRYLVLCVCFVDRCLSFCSFFFWPLCCLFFFDLLILITSLWYLQTLLKDDGFVTMHQKLNDCLPYNLSLYILASTSFLEGIFS